MQSSGQSHGEQFFEFFLRFCSKNGKSGRYLTYEDMDVTIGRPTDIFCSTSMVECQIAYGVVKASYEKAGLAVPEIEVVRVNCEDARQDVLPLFGS